MEALRFTDEYDAVAPLLGLTPKELRARDTGREHDVLRWIARRGDEVIGAAEALLRPDDRMFLRFFGSTETVATLSDEASADLGVPLYASVAETGDGLLAALHACGFVTEVINEAFSVPFAAALGLVRRAWLPSGYRLISAGEADAERLFRLDNTIRNLVPGTEGWSGDRTWFLDELSDPAAYVVGVHGGEYVGLIRIWRNPRGARLGLIGVLPNHRHRPLAAAMLSQALSQAADWGFNVFTTETSLSNRALHARLKRFGVSDGRFHQVVRSPAAG